MMAREGADISIVYLPAEQGDAENAKLLIEKEGQTCILIAGDLRDRNFCRHAVEEHVKQSGTFSYSRVLLANLDGIDLTRSMCLSIMRPNNICTRTSSRRTLTRRKTFLKPTLSK